MMEAMRILKATGLSLRRTVRLALWTGEEQGLLGSQAYVAAHFAERDSMDLKPGHAILSAYFNMDNGTGAIRGVCGGTRAAAGRAWSSWPGGAGQPMAYRHCIPVANLFFPYMLG